MLREKKENTIILDLDGGGRGKWRLINLESKYQVKFESYSNSLKSSQQIVFRYNGTFSPP